MSQLQIHVTNDQIFFENGYILYTEDGGDCWLVDPGFAPQPSLMAEYVKARSLKPVAIMLTHAHADHIAGVPEVLELFGQLPVYVGKEERDALSDARQNLSCMTGDGFSVQADDVRDLNPGEQLTLNGLEWQVLDVSGHSPGGRALYCASEGVVLVGDALFEGSIGRYDFPNSDGQRLLTNIRENLLTLPGDTKVLSGHGPTTSVEKEQKSNPFLAE